MIKKILIVAVGVSTLSWIDLIAATPNEISSHLSKESLPENALFTVGQSICLDKTIAEHAQALQSFEPYSKCITRTDWSSGDLHYTQWTGPKYQYDTYSVYVDQLGQMSFAHSCGSGFTIGFLAAFLNKFFSSNSVNKKVLYGALLSSAATVFYQNNVWGKIPYYTDYLERKDNYFAHISCNSTVRVICAMACTAIGFFGTKWAVDSIADTYSELSKKNNDTKDQFDQLLK